MRAVCNFDRFKAPGPEDEPKVIKICSLCGEGITEGEPFYKIGNLSICEKCIDECKEYAK